ncbi:NAD(P)H-dependent flavin oxidoreductase [Evansella clarkii]|uniref:NAD(P)H-dependent flavin oxidoreductase n=1 Tax=Evansella clarkii TaxID=79879 RepID=UPI000997A44A|nr:nitronate monooxygenase [Evansella clarkii]
MNILCEKLSITYPIIQGGMGNVSNAPLTGAISQAGALGTIGAGTMAPDELESLILDVKKLTDRPFCINIPITVQPYLKEVVQLVEKHCIPVVSLSAGNPAKLAKHFKDQGVKVICVVASVRQAQKAEQAGADVIVGEGYEAAGINSNFETTTLTLIPQLVKAVSVPVAAAGGIGDGRGLAAMLSLGVYGVQMGTRFIATEEALVHKDYKRLIVEASDTDTVVVGRTVGRIRRLLNTEYAKKLAEKEESGVTAEEFGELTNEDRHISGAIQGNLADGHLNSGQIAGIVDDLPPVSELIRRMMAEAEEAAKGLSSKLGIR